MKAALALLVACSSSPGFDRDIESHVTIDHGIYGQLTRVSDVGHAVTAFANGSVDLVGVGMTTTDGSGFYELAVAPGAYRECILTDYCYDVTVTGLDREDWEQFSGAESLCDGECSDRNRPR